VDPFNEIAEQAHEDTDTAPAAATYLESRPVMTHDDAVAIVDAAASTGREN
jgi:hypothetical protein